MEKLLIVVIAVILLGFALFIFTNIENIKPTKKDKTPKEEKEANKDEEK